MNNKHKVVIVAGGQVFEFDGELLELEDEYILLRAKKGDIFIERKYLVFIQRIDEHEVIPPTSTQDNLKVDRVAARTIKQALKKDPVAEKLVPLSQLADDEDLTDYYDAEEVMRNIDALNNTEHSSDLSRAVKQAMSKDNTPLPEYKYSQIFNALKK